MSNTKRRKEFNSAWRKARKLLRAAQTRGRFTGDEIILALKYKIDVLNGEKVR